MVSSVVETVKQNCDTLWMEKPFGKIVCIKLDSYTAHTLVEGKTKILETLRTSVQKES